MKKILIIDDSLETVEFLKLAFKDEGFEVVGCEKESDPMVCFKSVKPDFVIMDVSLYGSDGFKLCRDIRKFSQIPIIFLTNRDDVLDKVVGLELGADDYMVKPFEPKELLARIKAVLRRCEACKDSFNTNTFTAEVENVEYPGLLVDKTRYIAIVDGKRIDMPPKELELLFFLAYHPNRVFTREQLLGNVWGYDFFGESRTVDVHIKRIREKLDEVSAKHNWKLRTVWGVGYKFEVSEEE